MVELMIAVTILAILATVAIPNYTAAVRIARIGKCRHELMTMSHAIGAFRASNGGAMPLTLHQVGFGGRRDPWGTPYCYFNYADRTGDGLDWAVEAGLVDPAVVLATAAPSTAPLPPWRASAWPFGGSARPQGPLRPIADTDLARTRVAAVDELVTTLLPQVERVVSTGELTELKAALTATTGTVAVFVAVEPETTRRRDGFMFPLNSDYDLFSLGPDGRTAVSLGQTVARDDVIRANDGGYFGPAAEY